MLGGMRKVVIAGGSCSIGQELVRDFHSLGYEVVVLSRSSGAIDGARSVSWDGKSIGAWKDELNGATAVINLCGESVMQRWTPKSFQRIRDSRVDTTNLICEAVSSCTTPPQVWLNASAVGWYGDTGTREVSEASPSANDRLGRLCQEWESAVDKCVVAETVKTKIRIGIVFGQRTEAFRQLSKLTRLMLGGPVGTGRQYFSWIHIRDLARIFVWAVENPTAGALNATSPEPVQNEDLMAALRRHLGMPMSPPLPVFAVNLMTKAMGWDP